MKNKNKVGLIIIGIIIILLLGLLGYYFYDNRDVSESEKESFKSVANEICNYAKVAYFNNTNDVQSEKVCFSNEWLYNNQYIKTKVSGSVLLDYQDGNLVSCFVWASNNRVSINGSEINNLEVMLYTSEVSNTCNNLEYTRIFN